LSNSLRSTRDKGDSAFLLYGNGSSQWWRYWLAGEPGSTAVEAMDPSAGLTQLVVRPRGPLFRE
jgi:hypothetical protein